MLKSFNQDLDSLLYAEANNGPWNEFSSRAIIPLSEHLSSNGISILNYLDININKLEMSVAETISLLDKVKATVKAYKEISNSDEELDFIKSIKAFFCTYDNYFKMIINIVRIGNQNYSFYSLSY